MDGESAGQYLHPIAGLDAALWVPPSRGQLYIGTGGPTPLRLPA